MRPAGVAPEFDMRNGVVKLKHMPVIISIRDEGREMSAHLGQPRTGLRVRVDNYNVKLR